jgi:nitroimidazol reductase NimA-like FMN-containing flavoprotein (pyridoxamine 5'-phosphate oxidase superfamily)
MRRKEKEIKDSAEIEAVLKSAQICRLGLCDKGIPYVVPLCYGYKDKTLYFHSAPKGRKLDIIRDNNNVCFEVETDLESVRHEEACKWSFKYRTVIGFGKASLVEGLDAKREAFAIIMGHYSDGKYDFPESNVNGLALVRIDIEAMTGKRSGY